MGAPLALVAPAYLLVPVEPLASLGYLVLLLLPIGLLGGKMGDHGRINGADPQTYEGDVNLARGESADAGLLGAVGWRVGLLGLASFVLIGVLFV